MAKKMSTTTTVLIVAGSVLGLGAVGYGLWYMYRPKAEWRVYKMSAGALWWAQAKVESDDTTQPISWHDVGDGFEDEQEAIGAVDDFLFWKGYQPGVRMAGPTPEGDTTEGTTVQAAVIDVTAQPATTAFLAPDAL